MLWIFFFIEVISGKFRLLIFNMSRNMTKPTKWHVHPAKTQISLGIRPVWSVFSVCSTGSLGPKLSSCGQRRLISLGRCSGWSESSLGAQSFCWFCHKAAHICISARCGSSIGSMSAWHASSPEFDPHVRHILLWRLGHENISMAILPHPLIQEEQLSVTGERMCTKYS